MCIAFTTGTTAPTQNMDTCQRAGGGNGGAGGFSPALGGPAPAGGVGEAADVFAF